MKTIRSESYERRLKGWLDAWHLTEDPFALYEAEREGSRLSSFFVNRPYLYEVQGNPAAPQAAFLMAGRGCGKSATRAMVTYECQHGRFKRHVLVVDYTDFSSLLAQVGPDFAQLSPSHHVRAVMRSALKSVAEDISVDGLEALSELDRKLLMGFAHEFADSVTRFRLAAVIGEVGVDLEWDKLSPREILANLSQLVANMGREAVYVLVDRVDEVPQTANNPKMAAAMLRPLVAEQPLLEMPRVAFKFFLPIEVGTALQQSIAIRRDRLLMHLVKWDHDSLEKLIRLRLRYFSNEFVTCLEDLCESEARYAVMDRLLKTCGASPRTLLRLCGAVIQRHVEDASTTPSLLISRSTITSTLLDFAHQLEQEQKVAPISAPEITSVDVPSAPHSEGLYLDEHGHVWISGEKMTSPPSRLEIRLLEALYAQSPNIVGNEELIRAVWHSESIPWDPEAQPIQTEDETNLRKLVARLRKRLDSQFPGSGSRFIQNVRGRGYWLKTK